MFHEYSEVTVNQRVYKDQQPLVRARHETSSTNRGCNEWKVSFRKWKVITVS